MANSVKAALLEIADVRDKFAKVGLSVDTAVYSGDTATLEGTLNGETLTAIVNARERTVYINKQ